MSTAVGMEHDLERKALFGAEPDMFLHKTEITHIMPFEQAQDFFDMRSHMQGEAGQDFRIAGGLESRNFSEDCLTELVQSLVNRSLEQWCRLRDQRGIGKAGQQRQEFATA